MYICQLKDIDEAVCTGYFDVAARMLRNLIQEIEETNEKREWVGLTDEEIVDLACSVDSYKGLCKAIEAKLKEKNT